LSTIEDETGITAARYERVRVLKELREKIEREYQTAEHADRFTPLLGYNEVLKYVEYLIDELANPKAKKQE
jgi:hypothetical protein